MLAGGAVPTNPRTRFSPALRSIMSKVGVFPVMTDPPCRRYRVEVIFGRRHTSIEALGFERCSIILTVINLSLSLTENASPFTAQDVFYRMTAYLGPVLGILCRPIVNHYAPINL